MHRAAVLSHLWREALKPNGVHWTDELIEKADELALVQSRIVDRLAEGLQVFAGEHQVPIPRLGIATPVSGAAASFSSPVGGTPAGKTLAHVVDDFAAGPGG